eukprot:jgi/Bigna1/73340/fgenesh1_pg.23_\
MNVLKGWAAQQIASLMGMAINEVGEIVEFVSQVEDENIWDNCKVEVEVSTVLEGILGENKGVQAFVNEFKRRRQLVLGKFIAQTDDIETTNSLETTTTHDEQPRRIRREKRISDDRSAGKKQGRSSKSPRKSNVVSVEHSRFATIKYTKKKGKRKGKKGTNSAGGSKEKNYDPKQRVKCQCLATRHALFSNCTVCGRIVCEKEGEGPCFFCGSFVSKGKLLEKAVAASCDVCCTTSFLLFLWMIKNENGEGDYYDHGNIWLDKDEKEVAEELKKQKIEQEERKRSTTTVTIDFLEGKVIENNKDYYDLSNSRLKQMKAQELLKRKKSKKSSSKDDDDDVKNNGRGAANGIYANRTLTGRAEQVYAFLRQAEKMVLSGRVQHDDELKMVDDDYKDDNSHQQSSINRIVENVSKKTNAINNNTTKSAAAAGGGGSITSSPPPMRWYNQRMAFTNKEDKGVCLSMHQPWASLLVAGIKRFEGRSWTSNYRGRLWIASAARIPSEEEVKAVQIQYQKIYSMSPDIPFPSSYPTSALLGCVDMVDCLDQSEFQHYSEFNVSLLFPCYSRNRHAADFVEDSESQYLFVCQNPHTVALPQRAKGGHKFWDLSPAVVHAVQKGLQPSSQAW